MARIIYGGEYSLPSLENSFSELAALGEQPTNVRGGVRYCIAGANPVSHHY